MRLTSKIGRALAGPIRRQRIERRREYIARLRRDYADFVKGWDDASLEERVYGDVIAFLDDRRTLESQ